LPDSVLNSPSLKPIIPAKAGIHCVLTESGVRKAISPKTCYSCESRNPLLPDGGGVRKAVFPKTCHSCESRNPLRDRHEKGDFSCAVSDDRQILKIFYQYIKKVNSFYEKFFRKNVPNNHFWTLIIADNKKRKGVKRKLLVI
jgi:hypothetical protein